MKYILYTRVALLYLLAIVLAILTPAYFVAKLFTLMLDALLVYSTNEIELIEFITKTHPWAKK